MRFSRTSTAIALLAAMTLASCGRRDDKAAVVRVLDAATQRVAAEKLVRAFADVCLSAVDAHTAVEALKSKGWPAFTVVWDESDGIFYAAKPSPAGLFVIGSQRGSAVNLTCVGHYAADRAKPMLSAMEGQWGASGLGPAMYRESRAWSFTMRNGALASLPPNVGGGGPATAAALASLRPGQALVYAQVYANRPYRDVASLLSVWRLR